MNIPELKEKLLTSVDLWADARIDDMIKGNPMLAIPSVYMKRAAHNIISINKEKLGKTIDNAALFIGDENGDINVNTIFDDAMQMLKAVEDYHFELGFISGRIDEGTLYINLPDNIFTTLLFGSKKSISLGESDFTELKNLLTE